MKKSNRLSVRLLAFVMTLAMLFSFSATALAANVEIENTKYYTLGYDSESGLPKIVLTVNADELGQFVADRNFTKDELMNFLPEIFANALENKTMPSFGDIMNYFPKELFSYDELTKLIPEEVMSTILSAELIGSLLTDEALESLLTDEVIEELLTDDVLEALLTDEVMNALLTDAVLEALLTKDVLNELLTKDILNELLTKDVLDTLLTKDVLNELLTKDVLDALLTKDVLNELLTKDVLNTLLTKDVLNTLLTKDVLNELLTKEVMNALLTKDVLNTLLTKEVMNTLLTKDVLNKLLTKEVMNTLLTKDVLNTLLTKDVLNTLLTKDVLDQILTKNVLDQLLTKDVMNSLIGNKEDALTFVNAGVIKSDDVIALLDTAEQMQVAMADDKEGKAVELALANHSAELVALLQSNAEGVLSVIGIDKLIEAVTLDKIIATVGNDRIIEVVGTDKIIETVGNDKIIETVGTDKIVETVGNDKIIDAVGTDKIIETVGTDKIIETVGTDKIITTIGTDKIIATVGTDKIIETVGTDKIITTIGTDKIIATVGTDKIIATVGTDKIIETVGTDKIINTVGLDKIINTVGLDKIISTVGIDNIISTVGLDKIISTVGLDNIIATVGINNIITTVGIDRIITVVGLENIISVVDLDALKSALSDALIRVFSNQLEAISITTSTNGETVSKTAFECIETATNFEMRWNLNDIMEAITSSIPTVETLKTLKDGDTVYDIAIEMSFTDIAEKAGFGITFKVAGDTSIINTYAEKIFSLVNYEFDGTNISVEIDDSDENAPVIFAEVMTAALETSRLDDAEKAKLFSIFTKTGTDLIEALKELDFNSFSAFIDAKYISTLNNLCDRTVSVLEKAMKKLPAEYANISLESIYKTNGLFALGIAESVETDTVINKIASVLGVDVSFIRNNFTYDEVIGGGVNMAVQMQDVYRVRYYDANGIHVYTTFLPVGADLSVINDNTAAIKGLAIDGWKDAATYEVVTEMPAKDLDLIASVAKKTYTATFMADGKVVDTVIFTEGDTVLSKVPAVPTKTGFDGKWENYVLGNADIVINAIYTARTHTATFIADGKVVAEVVFQEGDTTLKAPRVPEKEGYYGRWQNYKLGTEDITIYAIYTNEVYTVVFNANGGEGVMSNQHLVYDVQDNLLENKFTREGYTFASWNTKADGTGYSYMDKALVMNITKLSGITLYAQWNKNAPDTRTVTFMANGVVVDKVTFEVGATTLDRVPAVPARTGYTGNWENYNLSDSDITVNAVYTANSYTVVYNANGGTGIMADQLMTYDTFATLTANAFKYTDYEFAGWNTKADGTGIAYIDGENVKNVAESGEVVLYAQWNEVETTTTETTTTATTTTPVEPVEDGFNWLLLVGILAALAVAGGVGGYLVYKKKKG